jgi:hypothetical protein
MPTARSLAGDRRRNRLVGLLSVSLGSIGGDNSVRGDEVGPIVKQLECRGRRSYVELLGTSRAQNVAGSTIRYRLPTGGLGDFAACFRGFGGLQFQISLHCRRSASRSQRS